ncbi:AraC family transcriptional regulator [Nocardia sp. 2]|uniref:AraC family transcriptional regulator n=1 Tax=Nocardia acididurans TaxID=2802282 RepID=A0ABS1M5E3_9NOCA|nr:helix-turn-helix domain-containing protein [Nocardia acididurans]MBL1075867.1 AraC family transcriptional regulator [Nocardia acididurans]
MGRDPRELSSSWRRFQRHEFHTPTGDLATHIAHYWTVAWEYEQPYRQLIVPMPTVHLTFRDGTATLSGPTSGHRFQVLEGTGSVFGVAFRPGRFRPFLGAPVSTIRNRVVDAHTVFDWAATEVVDTATVERLLAPLLPAPDPHAELAERMVAAIAEDIEVTRVDTVARRFGLGMRQVQRLFADYVGIGPKWVIRRYRLHEVTQQLDAGADIDWAALADALGYADQSHFGREFRKLFGETPTSYAQRY